MVKHNFLTNDQHGFVPGRDCITQLLRYLEEWTGIRKNLLNWIRSFFELGNPICERRVELEKGN